MRLESLRVQNFGPFSDFSVDLTTLPEEAKLVAVVGPNGAGKSTLLELFTGGALFRECPTRGSLTSLATSRAAVLEATVVNGSRWTIRHTVDGTSGKGESVVLDEQGRPATSDAKVRSFDAFAASHFPPPAVLYASSVSPQGSGGFLELRAGDRKAVLLRVLGVERLEELAKAARERARAAGVELSTLQARIVDEERRGGNVEEAERAVARAKASAAERAVELRRAEEELAVARELAKDSALARKVYEDAKASRTALQRSVEAKVGEVATLERKVANNRAVLAEAEAIREAVNRQVMLGAQLDEVRQEEAKYGGELRSLRGETAAKNDLRRRLEAAISGEEARANRLREMLQQAPVIQDAAAALPAQRASVEAARECAAEAERRLHELQGKRLAGADERIGRLRTGLVHVRDADQELQSFDAVQSIAFDTLEVDYQSERDATELPFLVEGAEREVLAERDALRKAEAELKRLERLAAPADGMEQNRRFLAEAEENAARAHAEYADTEKAHAELVEQTRQVSARFDGLSITAAKLTRLLEDVRPIAAKAEPLAFATARLEELEPQLAKLRADLQDEQERLASTPEPQPPEQAPDLWRLDDQVSLARDDVQAAARAVGAAEGALEQARASQAALGGLREQLATSQAELADWTRLADDLGRDGLQAAMIDAAGPELAALTNDLLRRTVGSRWTVTFDTQRASADGKKLVEGLDVRVIDTERGRDAQAESLSGGEKVIVGEAVSLALSMLACRRAGIERPTLVRDESGAALDPVNSRHYVAMLRRAADLVGADRVLVVSHSPEVQELCDERIEVGRG